MIRRIFLLFLLLGTVALHAQNQAQLGGGRLGGDFRNPVLTAANGERPYLRDPGFSLEADEIRYERETDIGTAIGKVVLTHGTDRLLADRLVYRRREGTFTADNVRIGRPPYFAEAFSAEGDRKEITLRRARVTYGEPGPWQPTWNADSITYAADGKIRSENSQIGIGHVQPLPFPKFQQDLKQPFAGAASVTGGYRRSLGLFVDALVLVPITPSLRLGADVGVFTSRGVMIGPAGRYASRDETQSVRGAFRSGYINDHGDKGVDILSRPVPERRGYFEWQHEQTIGSNLELKAQLNAWKDSEVLRDFRPRAFFPVQTPDTFAEGTYAGANYFFSAFVRAQPNRFHRVQERLPEVRFDLLPTTLGGGIYHRAQASAVALREDMLPFNPALLAAATNSSIPNNALTLLSLPLSPALARASSIPGTAINLDVRGVPPADTTTLPTTPATSATALATQPTSLALLVPDMRTNRLDAYYALERPFAPTSWFAFTPVAGGRITHYTNQELGGRELEDHTRTLGEIGFDAQLRTSGTFAYKNEQWKIDGLRHLFTPRLSYRRIAESHRGRDGILPIDRPAFSTYLQPLGLGAVRNLDDIREASTLRLGFDNLIQTRDPKEGTRDLLALNLASDFRFKRRFGERDVSEIHADLSLTPVRWLQFDLYQSFAPQNFTLRELNASLTLRSGNAWTLRFTNNYLRRQIEDYLVDARVRINESFEAVTRLHYDTRRSAFNEQAYGIAQNLGNTWLLSYTVSLYSGRRRESAFGFNIQIDTVRF